jgi:phospholipid transport system transporter-binding protein
MISTDADAMTVLPEQMTLSVAPQVLRDLSRSVAQQAGVVVMVDASALRAFDSSAVAVLLELRRSLAQGGKQLKLMDVPPKLRELVALYGVSELLPA